MSELNSVQASLFPLKAHLAGEAHPAGPVLITVLQWRNIHRTSECQRSRKQVRSGMEREQATNRIHDLSILLVISFGVFLEVL